MSSIEKFQRMVNQRIAKSVHPNIVSKIVEGFKKKLETSVVTNQIISYGLPLDLSDMILNRIDDYINMVSSLPQTVCFAEVAIKGMIGIELATLSNFL